MGPHPESQRHPAMPDPYRLARRSFRLLRSLGLDDESAWSLIAQVARTARFRAKNGRPGTDQWLSKIVSYAEVRELSCHPSTPITQESEHGDGPGRRTGGAAEHQDRAAEGR